MFKGWKKVSSEKTHTVMRNKEGHEFRIAHNALSPKLRGQLAEIDVFQEPEAQKLANGGPPVAQPSPKADRAWNKKDKEDFSKGMATQPPIKEGIDNLKKAFGFSNGGRISNKTQMQSMEDVEVDWRKRPGLSKGGFSEDAKEPAEAAPSTSKRGTVLDFTGDEATEEAEAAEAAKAAADVAATNTVVPENTIPEITQLTQGGGSTVPAAAEPDFFSRMTTKLTDEVWPAIKANLTPGGALPAATPPAAPTVAQGAPSDGTPKGTAADGGLPPPAVPEASPPAGLGMENGLDAMAGAPAAAPMAPRVDLQEQGLRAEAKAQGDLGREQAAIREQAAADLQESAVRHQEISQHLTDNFNEMSQGLKDGKIDPNRLWANTSTPAKIANIIGLIMGGIGQGVGGGKNPALEMINKQLDMDMDAQKTDLSNKQYLLGATEKHFNNLQVAENFQKGLMQEQAIQMLGAAASRSADPIAKARVDQAIGALRNAQAAKFAPSVTALQIQDLKTRVNKDPMNGQKYIDQVAQIDPKQARELQDRYVPELGFASSRTGAQTLMTNRSNLLAAQKSIARLQEIANMAPGTKELSFKLRTEAESIRQTLKGQLRVPITGPGALNESEIEILEKLIPNPTDIFSLGVSNKTGLATLNRTLTHGFQGFSQANGIAPQDPTAKLNGQQRAFYNWAKQQPPTNTKARMILEKLGIN